MSNWTMLTLIGEDHPGIVAAVTKVLYDNGVTLGEASMLRLGQNFTIMMMVSGAADESSLRSFLEDVVTANKLCLHIDPLSGGLHQHLTPNLVVHVHGADQPGIVSRVTGVLAESGFNILDLDSDVAGTEQNPLFIMRIAGVATVSTETLDQQLDSLREAGIDVKVSPVETLVG